MILEDWKNLSKRKKVTRICDLCKKEEQILVETLRQYNSTDICKSCKIKKIHTGRKKTKEEKLKISKSKKGKKTKPRSKEYIEKFMLGENNPFYGKTHSQESKNKMLDARKNNLSYRKNYLEGLKKRDISGPKNGMWGKPPAKPKRSKLKYKNVTFRSSWELKFAKYLDSNEVEWKYEDVCLKLKDGTGYTPDFICKNIIYEVKGYYWNDDTKFLEAKKMYPEYEFIIVDEKYLKQKGIL